MQGKIAYFLRGLGLERSVCFAIIVFAFTAAFLVASVAAFSADWALVASICFSDQIFTLPLNIMI